MICLGRFLSRERTTFFGQGGVWAACAQVGNLGIASAAQGDLQTSRICLQCAQGKMDAEIFLAAYLHCIITTIIYLDPPRGAFWRLLNT